MVTRKRVAPKSVELHVALEDITPPIWRRLLVPADIALVDLHYVLQVAMGWQDRHLHSFEFGDRTYSDDEEESGGRLHPEKGHNLAEALGEPPRYFRRLRVVSYAASSNSVNC